MENAFAGFVLGLFIGVISILLFFSNIEKTYQMEAAERGYAAWTIDQTTGHTEWRWIEPKAKP